ncbi:sulfite exporter TauE/SafE family protein [Treponema parvum]|uniref:sulfite exporter TauE/SafE family protein n=1 Tax=Treponema parvum TaxID=138851 RepID=UPI001AEBCB4E|nr:sulfite exporter TauE/SafE family protein [Treponema parvum]QTQ16100.1 sulfite exporter TauE/SafE family protein [Treponema parvum]
MEVVIIAVTLIATLVGSISGIGGGVIIKPVMDAVLDIPVSSISFLSGTTVLAMTAVSIFFKNKNVRLDRPRGTYLALGGGLGGIFGKMLFSAVKLRAGNDSAVGITQNVIMIILTGSVFFYVLYKDKIKTYDIKNTFFCVSAGLLLGILSSFLGIGGGPINIMILSLFFSLDSRNAALNSLYIIFFSQIMNLVFSVITGSVPDFSWPLLICMIVCGVAGASAGKQVSKKMDNRAVDRLFMGIMLVIIFISVYNVFRFLKY